MLAIAAPSFNAPSETFIHSHARTIAPGETILLCNDGRGTERFGCPILANIDSWRPPRGVLQRAVNAVDYRWSKYVDQGLCSSDRRRVLAFLESYRPTALLAEYGPTGCQLSRACKEAGIPLYVHYHGYDASMLLRNRAVVRHYRRLFGQVAGVITPSQFLAAKLLNVGCPASLLHVNPYGVDPRRFAPTRRLPNRVVAIGRLVEKKAPHLVVEAFGRVAARIPNARLDIVGDGPLAERCHTLIERLGLSKRVVMHGAQHAEFVSNLFQQASLFVQHSVTAENGDTEGLPVAILEAMASALPVVSTRHSGIPEAIDDGVTGLLVKEHDMDGMAAAMIALLNNPDRAAAMGRAGRQRVLECYTLERSCDRLRAIMELSSRNVPGALVAMSGPATGQVSA